jgi:hypothetical protein
VAAAASLCAGAWALAQRQRAGKAALGPQRRERRQAPLLHSQPRAAAQKGGQAAGQGFSVHNPLQLKRQRK